MFELNLRLPPDLFLLVTFPCQPSELNSPPKLDFDVLAYSNLRPRLAHRNPRRVTSRYPPADLNLSKHTLFFLPDWSFPCRRLDLHRLDLSKKFYGHLVLDHDRRLTLNRMSVLRAPKELHAVVSPL